MAKVFRIHDSCCRGPFKPGMTKNWKIYKESDAALKSSLIEFPWMWNTEMMNLAIGCTSIAQLKKWFSKKEYKKLLSLGYNAAIVDDVEIIERSNIQCVFKYKPPMIDSCRTIKLY